MADIQCFVNKIWTLYRITNIINNKIYIGQTIVPTKRWYDHCRSSSNPKVPISFAIRKYGNHNFTFEVIASCRSQEDANELETLLVKQYNSFVNDGYGYNATYGGMNAPKTDEWKKKVSESLMGHEVTFEAREKMSKSHTGMIVPDNVKEKIIIGNTGKEVSEETRKLLSEINMGNNHWLGKKHTEESKQKMSNNNKGKRPPKSTIQKSVEKTKGKTWKLIDGKRVWMEK